MFLSSFWAGFMKCHHHKRDSPPPVLSCFQAGQVYREIYCITLYLFLFGIKDSRIEARILQKPHTSQEKNSVFFQLNVHASQGGNASEARLQLCAARCAKGMRKWS